MPRRPIIALTLPWVCVGMLWTASSRAGDGPIARPKPAIMVHYMPWFESKGFSGAWGWHWTMNHFNPDQVDATGRRQVAAHLDPAIGPYDSLDPTVLEYHTLLMKVAGIDGAIIDWYGNENYQDYAGIHRRTLALIAALQKQGLKFAICYEDRAVGAIAAREKLTPEAATAHAATHLRFCQENWFADPAYLTWEGKPLLMVFGPDYLNPTQWITLFAGMRPAPAFFTLHERKDPAIGSFAWPPMWASKDGKLAPQDLDAYLDRFGRQQGAKIGAAFPGFHDIYAEAKVQPCFGFLDARDGATFRRTLDQALKLNSPVVQIATWNDFGEGTCVEPTREFGDRYLAMIQDARRDLNGSFPFDATDLKLPGRIKRLRDLPGPAPDHRRHLEAVIEAINGGDPRRAALEVDHLEAAMPTRQ